MSNQRKTENPMGAGKEQALRVTFDSRLKLEFHGAKVTSDAGLLAYRELDAALGLTDLGENMLNDWRTGKNAVKWTHLSCHDLRLLGRFNRPFLLSPYQQLV